MRPTLDLNADMGEGFGPYAIGDDAALLPLVSSISIATGFHAGDPSIMGALLRAAQAAGVAIGAHPGFADREGFGRRVIPMRTVDLEYAVAYQIGALAGLAAHAGVRLAHVKPHGALYNLAWDDRDAAGAIARAVRGVNPSLAVYAPPGSELQREAQARSLVVIAEGFADRAYLATGRLAPRDQPGAVITDPAQAAAQALALANGVVTCVSGETIPIGIATLCIHSDTKTAVAIAQAVRARLFAQGIGIKSPIAMA